MAQNDVYQIAARMLLPDDSVAVNVFYCRQDDVAPVDEEDTLIVLSSWVSRMYEDIEGLMDNEITFIESAIFKRNVVLDTWVGVGDFDITATPTVEQEMVSHGVAFVMRASTAVGKIIARKFLPGFGEQHITQSLWSGTVLTAVASFALEWITDFIASGGSFTPGTWSTSLNLFMPFTGESFLNIRNGYQRRRQPGVGE